MLVFMFLFGVFGGFLFFEFMYKCIFKQSDELAFDHSNYVIKKEMEIRDLVKKLNYQLDCNNRLFKAVKQKSKNIRELNVILKECKNKLNGKEPKEVK